MKQSVKRPEKRSRDRPQSANFGRSTYECQCPVWGAAGYRRITLLADYMDVKYFHGEAIRQPLFDALMNGCSRSKAQAKQIRVCPTHQLIFTDF